MRFVFAALAMVFVLPVAASQAQTGIRAEITDYGIYEGKVTQRVEAAGTVTGKVSWTDYEFVSKTTTVPARKGVRFGIEYRLIGARAGTEVPVRLVTIFPSEGLRNPKSGQVATRSEYIDSRTVAEKHMKGYSLDSDWEVVPGLWVLQVWSGEDKLAEKQFTLTPQ